MIRTASGKFVLAASLLILTASTGRAIAQSSTSTSTGSSVVTGTDPEPQVVTGTDPEPQDDIIDAILSLLFLA